MPAALAPTAGCKPPSNDSVATTRFRRPGVRRPSACALKRVIKVLLTSGGGDSRMPSPVALTNLRSQATSASVAASATATCSSTARASSSGRQPSTQSTSREKAILFLRPVISWLPPWHLHVLLLYACLLMHPKIHQSVRVQKDGVSARPTMPPFLPGRPPLLTQN